MTSELETPLVARPALTERHRRRGTVLILVASVCFGTSGPFAKAIMGAGVSAQHVASARITTAAVLLLVGVAIFRPSVLRIPRKSWPLVGAYGLFGVGIVQLLYFAAVARIPIGIAMLLEFTAPILVALWVRFVRRTVLPWRAWLGTALALTGLVLVAQVWQGLAFDALGLLFGVGTAFTAAAYFLLGERGVSSTSPLGLVTWGMIVGAAAIWLLAPPWTFPLEALGSTTAFGGWMLPVWLLLVLMAVVSTVLAYLLSIAAMQYLPSNVVSVLALCEPVVATVAAWVLLGQALTSIQILGAVVLLTGATVVQLSTAKPKPRSD
ncbi:EamA family transporter [Tenggerimyces flavus]|uniref:DMT family transporter n=1 Tax=Tenggerimyces flavus TaxID=1708749 RepID=A0ABV7Y6Y1_9ACTN|nr:EamA family transporter [Tenggerimyces flavus]MBM7785303.1 drug/metabolite transporter (DMT)-like permease [Tenggerimyces flavus]